MSGMAFGTGSAIMHEAVHAGANALGGAGGERPVREPAEGLPRLHAGTRGRHGPVPVLLRLDAAVQAGRQRGYAMSAAGAGGGQGSPRPPLAGEYGRTLSS